MQTRLQAAVQLREAGELEQARNSLLELAAEVPDDPQVNYQTAWVHDALGLEREAVPFYERALALGLAGEERAGALLGFGSTLRTLGEYEAAAGVLRSGVAEFPERRVFEAFLAMTLYNLGQHASAMEHLLRLLADTSNDATVSAYQRAIRFYADKLDETW
jgi:tetratricopeptide (TPR) repeat protein